MKQQGKTGSRKGGASYINSILSISLVLFIIGLLSVLVFQASKVSTSIKENFEVELELKDGLSKTDIFKLTTRLEGEPYFKSARYVSKEEAIEKWKDVLGDDPMEILDNNPLYAAVIVNLNSKYAVPDSLSKVESMLIQRPAIKDINYNKAVLAAVDNNINKFLIGVAIVGVLLFLIALTLIDNTIKLAMFSNRFIIRSMQLVGATRWFIIKPFVMKGVSNGLISGVLASIALIGMLYAVQRQIPDLGLMKDLVTFTLILTGIIGLGVFISWFSTHRAVLKYLKMKLDDLY